MAADPLTLWCQGCKAKKFGGLFTEAARKERDPQRLCIACRNKASKQNRGKYRPAIPKGWKAINPLYFRGSK